MTTKYFIDYQFKTHTSTRPSDDGTIVDIKVSDDGQFALIPNVGDFVHVDNSGASDGARSITGCVRSKLFRYIRTDDQTACMINIVLEETDQDFGLLVKE